MKRTDLEPGVKYVGPGGRCYEVVDLSPGWRVVAGEWVEDHSTHTRHVQKRGMVAYRSNVSIRALLWEEGQRSSRTTVDPRQLTGR